MHADREQQAMRRVIGELEDVLRAGLIIAKAGGITVVNETSYCARIRQGSACNPGVVAVGAAF